MYLLDTNYCSRIIQGEPGRIVSLQPLAGLEVATSVVVRGELVFMAEKSEQTVQNMRRVRLFLGDLNIYPVDEATADIYGELKCRILDHFGPKEKSKRRQTTVAQLGVGDNDIWIAATAIQRTITIVSLDSDFRRMQEAWPFPLESW